MEPNTTEQRQLDLPIFLQDSVKVAAEKFERSFKRCNSRRKLLAELDS